MPSRTTVYPKVTVAFAAITVLGMLASACGTPSSHVARAPEKQEESTPRTNATRAGIAEPIYGVILSACRHRNEAGTWPKIDYQPKPDSDFEFFELSQSGETLKARFKLTSASPVWLLDLTARTYAQEPGEPRDDVDSATRLNSMTAKLQKKLSDEFPRQQPITENETAEPGCHILLTTQYENLRAKYREPLFLGTGQDHAQQINRLTAFVLFHEELSAQWPSQSEPNPYLKYLDNSAEEIAATVLLCLVLGIEPHYCH